MLVYNLERMLEKSRMNRTTIGLFKASHIENIYHKEAENNKAQQKRAKEKAFQPEGMACVKAQRWE